MSDGNVDVYQRLFSTVGKPSNYSNGPLLEFRMFPSANKDRSAVDVARDAAAMHEEVLAGRCETILEITRSP